jgi:hypothetical protein
MGVSDRCLNKGCIRLRIGTMSLPMRAETPDPETTGQLTED